MTDLEITKLCAQAMGYFVIGEKHPLSPTGILCGRESGGIYHEGKYDPLHDDAQLMELVRKCGLSLRCQDFGGDSEWWEVSYDGLYHWIGDTNLNRAACLCVAMTEMHSAQLSNRTVSS